MATQNPNSTPTRFDELAKGKVFLAGGVFNPLLDVTGKAETWIKAEWLGMRDGNGQYNSKTHSVRMIEGDMLVKAAKGSGDDPRAFKVGEVLDFWGTSILDRTFAVVAPGSIVAMRYKGKKTNKGGRNPGADSHIHEVVVIGDRSR